MLSSSFSATSRERFVPGGAAPLAFAALAGADERIAQALRAVHVLGEAAALLAAARVVVGKVGIDARIVGGLLFADHHAIAHVHLPRAGAGAVGGMRGADDFVPRPDLAVEVFPAAIGIAAQWIEVSRQRTQHGLLIARATGQGEGGGRHGGGLDKAAPREGFLRCLFVCRSWLASRRSS